MSGSSGWFYATVRLAGSLGNWSTSYSWDGKLQKSRGMAISAGFSDLGHDDFLVGEIRDGALVWVGWMDEEHPDEYNDVTAALGLSLAERTADADGVPG